jgi:hypothetical protein
MSVCLYRFMSHKKNIIQSSKQTTMREVVQTQGLLSLNVKYWEYKPSEDKLINIPNSKIFTSQDSSLDSSWIKNLMKTHKISNRSLIHVATADNILYHIVFSQIPLKNNNWLKCLEQNIQPSSEQASNHSKRGLIIGGIGIGAVGVAGLGYGLKKQLSRTQIIGHSAPGNAPIPEQVKEPILDIDRAEVLTLPVTKQLAPLYVYCVKELEKWPLEKFLTDSTKRSIVWLKHEPYKEPCLVLFRGGTRVDNHEIDALMPLFPHGIPVGCVMSGYMTIPLLKYNGTRICCFAYDDNQGEIRTDSDFSLQTIESILK